MAQYPKIQNPYKSIDDEIKGFRSGKKPFKNYIESRENKSIFLLVVAIYEYFYWTDFDRLEEKYEFVNEIKGYFKEFLYYSLHLKKKPIDYNNQKLNKIITELEVLYQYLNPNKNSYNTEKAIKKINLLHGLFDDLRKSYLNEFDDLDIESMY